MSRIALLHLSPARRPSPLLPALCALLLGVACARGAAVRYPDTGVIDGTEDEVVFRPGQVLTYSVDVSPEDLAWIEEHGIDEEWKDARLTVTGLEEGPLELAVGFRHKGSVGTLGSCWTDPTVADDPATPEDEALLSRVRITADFCAKLSYKLKFSKDARFHGLKKLNLHSGSRDPTKLHELLAYSTFYDFGVDAPRAAPARLVVNGVFMGLFNAVEDVDDRYAKYHYVGADAGNLLKEVWPNPDVRARWGDDGYTAAAEAALQTNTDEPDVSDFLGFTAAVGAATADGFSEAMAPWLDLEELLRYMAVDRAIGNWDGVTAMYTMCDDTGCYSPGPHNLFWYHDTGTQGRFHLVPWDMDNTFQPFAPYLDPPDASFAERPVPGWNVRPSDCSPVRVWADSHVVPPGCDRFLNLLASTQWDRYRVLGRELAAGPLRADVLRSKAVAWSALLRPILEEDPYADLQDWFRQRDQLLDEVLVRAGPDFRTFLDEGYVEE